jgi:ribosome biogenesis ATPase
VRGRFARETSLPVPDAPSRTLILSLLAKSIRLGNDVDFIALGKATPGFVGSDLEALVREAGMISVARIVTYIRNNKCNERILNDIEREDVSLSNKIDGSNEVMNELELSDYIKQMLMSYTNPLNNTNNIEPLMNIADEILRVTMSDFQGACKSIQPSAKREGFAVVPDVTWSDVGALAEVFISQF